MLLKVIIKFEKTMLWRVYGLLEKPQKRGLAIPLVAEAGVGHRAKARKGGILNKDSPTDVHPMLAT